MKKIRSGILTCLKDTERAHSAAVAGGRANDANWAGWYADYLLERAALDEFTARRWNQEELAEALTHLNAAYFNGSQNQPWVVYVSARLST